ncbi:hypothetical protein [Methanococcoides burtonii]|uniref:Uncharacterized protein n=1 Tax=Methanococcoides burtonii (strain DSM 6242 / NBRC 107633 / OCM 468 / ACE-M) TaxID=259564 RepID=Q12WA8_METBU|nr:hypothetical protein [Methanococcoides burtonii]ABE52268.1 Hypothetical protein Mbur_1350 [Methanococcoides burtonii DSM 6242]
MLKRGEFGKILMLVLFVCFLSFNSANAAGDELNDSKNTNKFTDSNNTSSYFEESKDHPLYIASRGNIPETIDQQWKNSVNKCWLSITTERSVVELDPSVYAIASTGELLEVHLDSDYQEKINESKIDEIYRKINEHCEQEAGISNMPIVFMWAEDDEDKPLPDYGPEIFEEAKRNPSVIAVYGTMPIIEQESDKRAWTDLLGHTKHRELDPFFAEFDGPVLSYGVSINGYLSVGMDLETPEKVNESVIDEIYQTIDRHFEQKASIIEVPVVFEWEGRAVLDEMVEEDIIVIGDDGNLITYTKDEAYYDEDGNLVIIGNKTTQEEPETKNQLPGFTALMLIIGLLLSTKSGK